MRIPFVTDSLRGRLPVNYYPVKDDERGMILVGTPGKVVWCDLGSTYTRIRAAYRMGNTLYVVANGINANNIGSTFFAIDRNGTATVKGWMRGSTGNNCWIVGNGSQIWISDGTEAWTYTVEAEFTRTITKLTSEGTLCTAESEDFGFRDGATVTISGANEDEYNGEVVINRIAQDRFTYNALTEPSAATATGTSIIATSTVTDSFSKARNNDTDFPASCGPADFIDGYVVFIESNTGKFWITGLNDAGSIDGLDFASAEGLPDNNVGLIVQQRQVVIFGEESTEVWYNSGAAAFPFERMSGGFIEHGLAAAKSPAKLDNTVYWLTEKGQVVKLGGENSVQIVSTRLIERAIEAYSDISDAIGWGYVGKGQTFYVLTFPTANVTWVFDAATGLWHERSSLNPSSLEFGRDRSNCYAYFNRKHLVGDAFSGKIFEISDSVYSEDGLTMPAIVYSQDIQDEQKTIFHHRVELEFKRGTALATGRGSDPQTILQYSDDGGETWSDELWHPMGLIGEYTARCVWQPLGASRNRRYRSITTDPVERVLYGGYTEISKGIH